MAAHFCVAATRMHHLEDKEIQIEIKYCQIKYNIRQEEKTNYIDEQIKAIYRQKIVCISLFIQF